MDSTPLSEKIISHFEQMSAQLQTAARFILQRPQEVALLSMREQARIAGVKPATMTRLAKFLGLDGYEDVRKLYASAMRGANSGFAGKAGAQAARQKLKGDKALALEIIESSGAHLHRLLNDQTLANIVSVAKCLAGARHVYCLGIRSGHSVAWHLHYILTLIGEKSIYVGAGSGIESDTLAAVTSEDVLLAVSVQPYTRWTFELAEYAAQKGAAVVAITDSEVAPLAQIACHAIVVPTESSSFLHTMAPAFLVAEVLGAIVAGRGGEEALTHLRRTDEHLAALGTYLQRRPSRSSK